MRHGRRRTADVQHFFGSGAGGGGRGAKVAKHGNRAVTSRCGSADVLEALGVPVTLRPELGGRVPARHELHVPLCAALSSGDEGCRGICAKRWGSGRSSTLCGPLTNPAGARAQVIGVLAPSRVLLVARALAELGARRAFVVHGTDGIDELTTTGESIVARIVEGEDGKPALKGARITPEMAGLPIAKLEDFTGGDVAENSALLYDVLTGIPGARRDIVLLNAAAALVAAELAGDLKEGVAMGAEAIDSGQAAATLAKLREFGKKYERQ